MTLWPAAGGQIQALLGSRDRDLVVAGGERDERATEQRPGQRLRIPGQAGGFDGRVEELGGFGQPTEHAPRHAQGRVDAREQLGLAGCASDRQRALRVALASVEAVEVDLRTAEIDGGGQPARRARRPTGASISAAASDRTASPRSRRRPRPAARARIASDSGRQRRVAERPRRSHGPSRPVLSGGVLQAEDASPASSIISPTASAPASSGRPSSAVRRAWALIVPAQQVLDAGGRGGSCSRSAVSRRGRWRGSRGSLDGHRRTGRSPPARLRWPAADRPVRRTAPCRAAAAAPPRTSAPRSPARAARTSARLPPAWPRRPYRRSWPRSRRDGPGTAAAAPWPRVPAPLAVGSDAASRRAWLRRPRGARSDVGSGTAAARWSAGSDRRCSSSIDGVHRLLFGDVGRGGRDLRLERIARHRRALQQPPRVEGQQGRARPPSRTATSGGTWTPAT